MCSNLGNFSFSSDEESVCYGPLVTSVYGTDLNSGSIVYSDILCTTPFSGAIFSDGFYSYETDSFGVLQDPTPCTCTQFYCISNTGIYDDEYQSAGSYAGNIYFTGQTSGYFIFFSSIF